MAPPGRGVHPAARARRGEPVQPLRARPAPGLRRLRAARSRPTTRRWWGDDLDEGVRRLVAGRPLSSCLRLRRRAARVQPCGRPRWPAHGVGLRCGSAAEFRIARPDGHLVGTVDEGRAFESGAPRRHLPPPGAALPRGAASTSTTTRPWSSRPTAASTTQARSGTDIAVLGDGQHRDRWAGPSWHLGRGGGHHQVIGYQRKRRGHRRGARQTRRSTYRRPRCAPGPSGTRSTTERADRRRARLRPAAGHTARRRARGHRHAAAVHHLRPLGRGRRLDRLARRHRRCPRS